MIRRPPRSTLDRSSAASDVYKRQILSRMKRNGFEIEAQARWSERLNQIGNFGMFPISVSYTHLRAHETVLDLVCRLLLEKKNNNTCNVTSTLHTT